MTIFFRRRGEAEPQIAEVPQAAILEINQSQVALFDGNGTEVYRADLERITKVRWRQEGGGDGIERFVNLEVIG